MRVVAADKIERTISGDLEVVGFRWLNDDHDLELLLRAPGPKAQGVARLLATWASDIRMNLDLSGHIGLVPAWEVTINRLQTGWGVAIDLRPWGAISFACNDLTLEVPE